MHVGHSRGSGVTGVGCLEGSGGQQSKGVDGQLGDLGRISHLGYCRLADGCRKDKPRRQVQFRAGCSDPYMKREICFTRRAGAREGAADVRLRDYPGTLRDPRGKLGNYSQADDRQRPMLT